MTPADMADVLATVVVYDDRSVGITDIAAWHKAVGDLDVSDAIEAVARHYGHSTERIKPGHVRALAAEIDRDRRRAAREAREAAQAEAERLAIEAAPRTDRSRELADMIRETVAKVTTPDAAHERALLVARQMKGRPVIPAKTKRQDKPKRIEHGPPKDSATAALARQYLADGYSPDDLSERLWISKKWLRRAASDRALLPPPTPVPHVIRNPKESAA